MEIVNPNYPSQNFQFSDINDKELENVNKTDWRFTNILKLWAIISFDKWQEFWSCDIEKLITNPLKMHIFGIIKDFHVHSSSCKERWACFIFINKVCMLDSNFVIQFIVDYLILFNFIFCSFYVLLLNKSRATIKNSDKKLLDDAYKKEKGIGCMWCFLVCILKFKMDSLANQWPHMYPLHL